MEEPGGPLVVSSAARTRLARWGFSAPQASPQAEPASVTLAAYVPAGRWLRLALRSPSHFCTAGNV